MNEKTERRWLTLDEVKESGWYWAQNDFGIFAVIPIIKGTQDKFIIGQNYPPSFIGYNTLRLIGPIKPLSLYGLPAQRPFTMSSKQYNPDNVNALATFLCANFTEFVKQIPRDSMTGNEVILGFDRALTHIKKIVERNAEQGTLEV